MSTANSRCPTISEVYAAFSSESDAVFRGAKAASRGGTVRVADLLAALVSNDMSEVEAVVPPGWRPVPPWRPPEEAGLVPMANEPRLREVFRTAYSIARAQPELGSPVITPKILWAALFVQRCLPYRITGADLFERLGLACPPALGAAPQPIGRMADRQTPPSAGELDDLIDGRDLVDVVLERWLAVQSIPPGDARVRAMAGVARLAQQLESRPCTP